TKHPKKGVEKY
nr:Chain W, Thermonuclease [synthetic construct]2GSI_X Chain X, Thermonuclease [synthetic construct]2GSI_Y Chain Y, Thermonuclease [synthetic construct]2GSI_Z Chain Z, Thermonuclease [synthetic construct]